MFLKFWFVPDIIYIKNVVSSTTYNLNTKFSINKNREFPRKEEI